MAQNIAFATAAVATGVGAKAMDLPTAFSGLLMVAVMGVCLGVTSFLKVDVPKIQPKAKKMSKKEKRALAAAEHDSEDEADEAEAIKAAAKALKKREKEQARKKAKKEAAAKAIQEAEQAEKQKTAEAAQPAATAGGKKKKKKKKKNAPKVEEPVVEEEEVVAEEPQTTGWEEVKMKKGKKKVEEANEDGPVISSVSIYVERKHFGTIIGKGGETLKLIIEATKCQIELPKEGGMRTEILIEGPNIEACNVAKKAIKQLVAKGYSDLTDPTKTDTTVAVPERKRAVLIGPGGRNIKMIQEKCGVRINMPEKGSEDEVSLVGDSDGVKLALKAIKQLIEQGYSDITHENYMKTTIEVPRDMLKTLIGKGGSTIRGLQDECKVRINVPSDAAGEIVFVTLLGEPEGVAECRAKLVVILAPPPPVPIADEWQQAASQAAIEQLTEW